MKESAKIHTSGSGFTLITDRSFNNTVRQNMNKITALGLLLISPLGCKDVDHPGSSSGSLSRTHPQNSSLWTVGFVEQVEALRIARDFSEEALLLPRHYLNHLVTTNRKCIHEAVECIEVTFHDPDKFGCFGPYGPNIKYEFPHFYRLRVETRSGKVVSMDISNHEL